MILIDFKPEQLVPVKEVPKNYISYAQFNTLTRTLKKGSVMPCTVLLGNTVQSWNWSQRIWNTTGYIETNLLWYLNTYPRVVDDDEYRLHELSVKFNI